MKNWIILDSENWLKMLIFNYLLAYDILLVWLEPILEATWNFPFILGSLFVFFWFVYGCGHQFGGFCGWNGSDQMCLEESSILTVFSRNIVESKMTFNYSNYFKSHILSLGRKLENLHDREVPIWGHQHSTLQMVHRERVCSSGEKCVTTRIAKEWQQGKKHK